MRLEDVADRETISVEDAGAILGLRRSAAYEAARRGQIPTLTLGRRKLVSVRRLAAILGADWFSYPVARLSWEGSALDGGSVVRCVRDRPVIVFVKPVTPDILPGDTEAPRSPGG